MRAFTSSLCYLQELDLSYTKLSDSEMDILCTGLKSKNCKLEVLRYITLNYITHFKIEERLNQSTVYKETC